MNTPKFQRTVEDFQCEHCGSAVKGNGYTNHCPACLWSKHVDVNPGDRAALCGGMMEPVALEGSTDEYTIVHQCVVCKKMHRNKQAAEDNLEMLIGIANKRGKGNN